MHFKDLSNEEKLALHEELVANAKSIGGTNFFLQMIETIKEEKPHALLNVTASYHYPTGIISWQKSIYKDTLSTLFNAMRKEEADGDMINGLKPKEYKATMNMMRALQPVKITIKSKKDDSLEGFSLCILDSTQNKKTKVSLMFKILFFYNISFAKEVLNYES
ncbi:MAG: hypothetical protein U9N30_03395 [Campylobacterota bacterium]|nr:hypothetical protein [Campylobacterota bacterium]